MKRLLTAVILFAACFPAASAFSQEPPAELFKSWSELKNSLQLRTRFVFDIPANVQQKANPEMRRLFDESREMAIDFDGFVTRRATLDSTSLRLTLKKTNRLAINITRVMNQYREDPAISDHEFFRTIIQEVQRIDSRIAKIISRHNELCRQLNRSDLLFEEER